jgi:hypothetical protein
MDKVVYMRNYKKLKYNEDPTKARQYQNSLRFKQKNNINDETWEKYKHLLYDVYRLKDLMNILPRDLILEILHDNVQTLVSSSVSVP